MGITPLTGQVAGVDVSLNWTVNGHGPADGVLASTSNPALSGVCAWPVALKLITSKDVANAVSKKVPKYLALDFFILFLFDLFVFLYNLQ